MSKKQIFTLILAVTALTADIAFAASVPGTVPVVKAEVQGSEIRVSWDAVDEAAFYRVYFSHASILENDGNYDDYEKTPGAQTEYVFSAPPLQSSAITFGVLAVDAAGNESEGFETEATVEIAPKAVVTTSSSSSAMTKAPEAMTSADTSKPMAIESVRAVSGTGVLLTFTKEIKKEALITPTFFMITESGTVLPVKKAEVVGRSILMTTGEQKAGTTYGLVLLRVIPAEDGTNAPPSSLRSMFEAFDEKNAPAASTVAPPPTYGRAPSLTGTEAPVTMSMASSTSSVMQKEAPVTANMETTDAPILRGNVIPTKGPAMSGKPLPSSGVGTLGLMSLAGAAAGARLRRKKSAV